MKNKKAFNYAWIDLIIWSLILILSIYVFFNHISTKLFWAIASFLIFISLVNSVIRLVKERRGKNEK